jgi:hypothetical protein
MLELLLAPEHLVTREHTQLCVSLGPSQNLGGQCNNTHPTIFTLCCQIFTSLVIRSTVYKNTITWWWCVAGHFASVSLEKGEELLLGGNTCSCWKLDIDLTRIGWGGNSSELCSGGDQLESQPVFCKSIHANFMPLFRPCPLLRPFHFIIH